MRERYVELRGLRLCLCEWGTAGGPVVVLLHGWMDQGAAWAEVAEHLLTLRPDLRVLAPDQRGFARSDHPGPGATYHFPDYVLDLDLLARAEGWPPVALVGHSMGGTVASYWAGLRPEAVRSLVLVEGLGPPSVTDEDAVAHWRLHLDQTVAPPAAGVLPSLEAAAERLRRLVPAWSPERALALAARATRPLPDGTLTWAHDPLHRTRSATAYQRSRHLAVLRCVTAPTLLVRGEASWWRLDDLAERAASLPVAGDHVLPGGHMLHAEQPRRLAEIVASGLGGLQAEVHTNEGVGDG